METPEPATSRSPRHFVHMGVQLQEALKSGQALDSSLDAFCREAFARKDLAQSISFLLTLVQRDVGRLAELLKARHLVAELSVGSQILSSLVAAQWDKKDQTDKLAELADGILSAHMSGVNMSGGAEFSAALAKTIAVLHPARAKALLDVASPLLKGTEHEAMLKEAWDWQKAGELLAGKDMEFRRFWHQTLRQQRGDWFWDTAEGRKALAGLDSGTEDLNVRGGLFRRSVPAWAWKPGDPPPGVAEAGGLPAASNRETEVPAVAPVPDQARRSTQGSWLAVGGISLLACLALVGATQINFSQLLATPKAPETSAQTSTTEALVSGPAPQASIPTTVAQAPEPPTPVSATPAAPQVAQTPAAPSPAPSLPAPATPVAAPAATPPVATSIAAVSEPRSTSPATITSAPPPAVTAVADAPGVSSHPESKAAKAAAPATASAPQPSTPTPVASAPPVLASPVSHPVTPAVTAKTEVAGAPQPAPKPVVSAEMVPVSLTDRQGWVKTPLGTQFQVTASNAHASKVTDDHGLAWRLPADPKVVAEVTAAHQAVNPYSGEVVSVPSEQWKPRQQLPFGDTGWTFCLPDTLPAETAAATPPAKTTLALLSATAAAPVMPPAPNQASAVDPAATEKAPGTGTEEAAEIKPSESVPATATSKAKPATKKSTGKMVTARHPAGPAQKKELEAAASAKTHKELVFVTRANSIRMNYKGGYWESRPGAYLGEGTTPAEWARDMTLRERSSGTIPTGYMFKVADNGVVRVLPEPPTR